MISPLAGRTSPAQARALGLLAPSARRRSRLFVDDEPFDVQ
jgi:hypothetical protein